MRFTSLLSFFLACAFSTLSMGDTIIGQVVDSMGVGVPGVDIDVTVSSGTDPTISNDGTNANGIFVTTVPAGLYDISFRSPPAPATSHLAMVLSNVLVVGQTNLGVVTLPPGVVISGQLVDGVGLPVANVVVDVIDRATGDTLANNNNRSDLFGSFFVTAPFAPIYLELRTAGVSGGSLVPRRMELEPMGDLNLGSLELNDGFPLSGTVVTATGDPIPGLDLDVLDTSTGLKVFTPNDNTDPGGDFSILLPVGIYDVEICPPLASRLVAKDFEGLLFQGALNLGAITLEDGVVLTGTVRDVAGIPLPRIDLEVRRSATGASVVTCGDDTNANGVYSVIVPSDVIDVSFAQAGAHGTSAADLHVGLSVTGDMLLDGVIPAPQADFFAPVTSGLSPLTVDFRDATTGAVLSWFWSFGDGGVSNLSDPVHVYTEVGTYTVALTVDGIGGPSTEVKTGFVTVQHLPPTAAFQASPTTGTRPLTVTFTDGSAGEVSSWSWSFGDGGSSTLQHPVVTYEMPGTYTVALTASGPGGSNIATELDYVTVSEAPPVTDLAGTPLTGVTPLSEAPPVTDFAGTPLTGVTPLAVTFADLSTGVVTAWSWNFGDMATSTLKSPLHTYTAAGTYTVFLTATGPGGSSNETKLNYVSVAEPAPVASFVGAPLTGMAPLTVTFADRSTGAVTGWSWNFGDLGVSALQNPEHTFVAAGTYSVGLTASGPGGMDVLIRPSYILVTEPKTADFIAHRVRGGVPLRVSFTDLTTGTPISWFWNFGDGKTSTLQHPKHIYTQAGTYSVSLAVMTSSGVLIETKSDYIHVRERRGRAGTPTGSRTRPAPNWPPPTSGGQVH